MLPRFSALANLPNPEKVQAENSTKVTAIFAENVFTNHVARQFLSDEAYKSLQNSIKAGQKIDRFMANQIANGIRAWAETKGVSHFTHWFQPLTGTTAEKHDSFFTLKSDGTPIEQFEGINPFRDGPEIMVFKLLAFCRAVAKYGPSACHQVGTCIEQAFVNYKIFLFPTQCWSNLGNIPVKIITYIHSCIVHSFEGL